MVTLYAIGLRYPCTGCDNQGYVTHTVTTEFFDTVYDVPCPECAGAVGRWYHIPWAEFGWETWPC